MAKHRGSGDWLVLEEMLERGDPAFVDALRAFHDADALAGFAARWYGDKRAASRRLLLEYLDRPLNAYRHEVLVKRLFKAAEAAGDDEAMARFLVLFDRSIRREVSRRTHFESRTSKSRAEAEALIGRWKSLGPEYSVSSWEDSRGQVHSVGRWSEPVIRMPIRNDDAARRARISQSSYGRAHPRLSARAWAQSSASRSQGASGTSNAQTPRSPSPVLRGDSPVPEAPGLALLPTARAE